MVLSDGTILVGGSSPDLAWLPQGTSISPISPVAANGSSIAQQSVSSGKTAFLLRLSADGSNIIQCLHFPSNEVEEIRWIKTDTVPAALTTGHLYISGKRGSATVAKNSGGFFIAKLNANFLTGTPTALDFVYNLATRGKDTEHGEIQPWDVMSDGRIVAHTGGPYEADWAEILVLSANPGVDSPANTDATKFSQPMPLWRNHTVRDAQGATSTLLGTATQLPTGSTLVASRLVMKTQQTGSAGLLRSFTFEEFHTWKKDENGFWRKGTYPLDAFWNNYWTLPENGINNVWGADAVGYTGYKLSGTGGTEGSPYTPRVGAIAVDRRSNRIYIGLNWQTRLPATNWPDFEPALVILSPDGNINWWARLYKEYNDNAVDAPSAIHETVTQVISTTQIRIAGLAGKPLDIQRRTSGSDGYVNGYRRLYWKAGSQNGNQGIRFSNIVAYDQATGTLTLEKATTNPILSGDPFIIDATEMMKTHTSTPDQYIDAIAIDYSTPAQVSGNGSVFYVAARCHGNNVSNFWNGNAIAANPGGQGFVNNFTGSNGNIHIGWIGKFRDEVEKGTILASTYVAEFIEVADFGDYSGMSGGYSDANLDDWPSHNAGWPDVNTTRIDSRISVDSQGRVLLTGYGRSVHTTADAFQRNIRPYLAGQFTAVSSASSQSCANLVGSKLNLGYCRIRWNGHIRTITAFDDATGQWTLDAPFPTTPPVGASFRIDEGVGTWANFVRVYSADLSSVVYSSLFSSTWNPVDGAGGGRNMKLFGALPISGGRLFLSGYHDNLTGNPLPINNKPSWGASISVGGKGVIGFLAIGGSLAKSNQTINSFLPISNCHLGVAPFSVSVPTASSGLPVQLTIKSGPATLSGNILTITGYGTVVLSANQPGNDHFEAASEVTTSFQVTMPIPVVSYALWQGLQGALFSKSIVATNTPAAYALSAGSLPAGLSLNSTTGLVSGIPIDSGNFFASFTASNSGGTSGPQTVAVTIAPTTKPVITSSATANATMGSPFNHQVTALNNPTSFSASGLPGGLLLNTSTGIISGTPSLYGTYAAKVFATNANGTLTQNLTLSVAAIPPVITNNGTIWARAGVNLSYRITALNAPKSFGASGLPAGLTLHTTNGTITGTPTAAGNATVVLSATNPAGTATKSLVFAITPQPPVITSSTMANGTTGQAFSHFVTATNGPVVFSAVGLPPGLTLNATSGLVGGIPTADGAYAVRMTAKNAGGLHTQNLTCTIALVTPVITNNGTVLGRVGVNLSYRITALNAPKSFGASGLPPGLMLNTANGTITGIPTAAGNTTVVLSATNPAGTATKSLVFAITPPPPAITSSTTANGTTGQAFSHLVTATNGPIVFSALGLPPGLTLNATSGLVGGIPTADGIYAVRITAKNAGGFHTQNFTCAITPITPVITNNGTVWCRAGANLSYRITALNAPKSFGASGLPAGLTLHTTNGTITGTPTAAGNATVVLSATNPAGTATKSLVFAITPQPPVITSSTMANGTTGQAFSHLVTATNGPVVFSTVGLPPGLTLNATSGLVGGTPTANGIYAVRVTAKNTGGFHTQNLTCTIVPPPPQ